MSKRSNKAGRTKAETAPGAGDNAQAPHQDLLERAMRDHGAGRLAEAEALYRRALDAGPDDPVALHLLGVIAHQTGRHQDAVDMIAKALALKPDYGDAHNNLGLALGELGRLEDAVRSYEQAIAHKPDFASAHYNLAIALQELGRLDDAVAGYRRALAIKPDFAEALSNLGNALQRLGRLDDAVASHRDALAVNPDFAEAHYNLGNALDELGRREDAVASYRSALAVNPDFANAYNNLGNVLLEMKQPAEAEACCRRALELTPASAETLINLGNALKDLGRPDDAIASYRDALAIRPDLAEAHFAIGMVRRLQGGQDDAIAGYRDALAIDPDHAEALNNLACVLHDRGELEEAEQCFRRGLALEPDSTPMRIGLGNVLRDVGFDHLRTLDAGPGAADGDGALPEPETHPGLWDEVLECADRVLARAPGSIAALGLKTSALIGLRHLDDWASLCDFDNLMLVQTIDVPSGYADLKAFNDEILERCLGDPTLIKRPCESMTAGQRIYNLQDAAKLGPSHPLLRFMDAAVERYRAAHPVDAGHPFLARRPAGWRLDVWGSIIEDEGQMRAHNHPEAWLSGVYYAKLPDVVRSPDADRQGWIEFGRPPRYPRHQGEPAFRVVQPEEGLLLLWPSYLFHGTVPFKARGTRFSIAVDVMPEA